MPGETTRELTALEFFSVFLKHYIEVFNFGLQVGSWEAKEYDASVSESLVKDQLAEIAVSNHQNTLLFPGDCQDVLIGKTRRIVLRDSENVMAKLTKMRQKAKFSALVEEEFRRAALV